MDKCRNKAFMFLLIKIKYVPFTRFSTFVTMTSKCAILLCYWGGNICDGPEGVCYNKPPSKAIKVQPGIKFNKHINQLHVATSIDKEKIVSKSYVDILLVLGK